MASTPPQVELSSKAHSMDGTLTAEEDLVLASRQRSTFTILVAPKSNASAGGRARTPHSFHWPVYLQFPSLPVGENVEITNVRVHTLAPLQDNEGPRFIYCAHGPESEPSPIMELLKDTDAPTNRAGASPSVEGDCVVVKFRPINHCQTSHHKGCKEWVAVVSCEINGQLFTSWNDPVPYVVKANSSKNSNEHALSCKINGVTITMAPASSAALQRLNNCFPHEHTAFNKGKRKTPDSELSTAAASRSAPRQKKQKLVEPPVVAPAAEPVAPPEPVVAAPEPQQQSQPAAPLYYGEYAQSPVSSPSSPPHDMSPPSSPSSVSVEESSLTTSQEIQFSSFVTSPPDPTFLYDTMDTTTYSSEPQDIFNFLGQPSEMPDFVSGISPAYNPAYIFPVTASASDNIADKLPQAYINLEAEGHRRVANGEVPAAPKKTKKPQIPEDLNLLEKTYSLPLPGKSSSASSSPESIVTKWFGRLFVCAKEQTKQYVSAVFDALKTLKVIEPESKPSTSLTQLFFGPRLAAKSRSSDRPTFRPQGNARVPQDHDAHRPQQPTPNNHEDCRISAALRAFCQRAHNCHAQVVRVPTPVITV